ncbi:MAG TPA: enoyl-CoA hydratase/isomerase family protein [Gemmatimonadaceae bacterium]|nr:enoyl-CoA hydratase/isomerase family protein [Gemmatimonadaceae bacterium]
MTRSRSSHAPHSTHPAHPPHPAAAPRTSHPPLGAQGGVSSLVADGIADVAFGHPKSNSLPASVLRALAEEIRSAGARADVRVILLRSYGAGAFCAGASFDELVAIDNANAGTEFFMGFARVILAMTRCAKPIVTRVHGKAVGGGVGVVAASDYALATEKAALRLSELAVGIGPFVVGPAIAHKVGAGAFGAMAIDADWRDAAWGERHGLYARVVPDVDTLDREVDAFARKLADANPEALSRIKQVTWQGTEGWPDLLEERAAMSGSLVLSDYTRRAIAEFRS